MRPLLLFAALLLIAPQLAPAPGPHFFAYIGSIGTNDVVIAWGHANGSGNTIGRDAESSGKAKVTVGSRTVETQKSWVKVDGLQPDTPYTYSLELNGEQVARGNVRTYPVRTGSFVFFVIGDWGNGSSGQYEVAKKMIQEKERLEKEGKPVRFVISNGDNIYGFLRNSGNRDSHWESKFFVPYRDLISSVPFYAVIGNHDGNESENTDDLDVYLDNFFFPQSDDKHRWYRFQVANLVEFFMLDSSRNTNSDEPKPVYLAEREQTKWLEEQLSKPPTTPWRVAVFHHPMFTAGPRHEAALPRLQHWFDLFRKYRVDVVFSGHEHNFQVSTRDAKTGNIQFFVSGAGGELRGGALNRTMTEQGIVGWAPQRHFLIVDVNDKEMRVSPVGPQPIRVRNAAGATIPPEVVVPRRER